LKTIKQIADELGISKQRMYRFIRKNFDEAYIAAHQNDAGVMCFDDAAEKLIKTQYMKSVASKTPHQMMQSDTKSDTNKTENDADDTSVNILIAMLQKELEIKNKQIESLNEALLNAQHQVEAAQVLHAADKRQLLTDSGLEGDKPKKSLWDRLLNR